MASLYPVSRTPLAGFPTGPALPVGVWLTLADEQIKP